MEESERFTVRGIAAELGIEIVYQDLALADNLDVCGQYVFGAGAACKSLWRA